MSFSQKSNLLFENTGSLQQKLQLLNSELLHLKQELQIKDQRLLDREREIHILRSENMQLSQKLLQLEKILNSHKISSYSKATNSLFDKLTNPPSYETSLNQNPAIAQKPKKTFYNGQYFKKNKDYNISNEEIIKSIEARPSHRKNSNNILDIFEKAGSIPQLYENFMVISSTRDSFENAIEDNYDDKSLLIPPSTLLLYPNNELNSNIKKTVENYCFPFGVKIKELAIDESFSQLNQILFMANNLMDQRSNCFTFLIKTEESYNKPSNHHNQCLYEGIRNFINSNNASKDSCDAFIKLNQLDLLELANPNSFLYCYGVRTLDFIEAKGDSAQLKNKTLKKKRFFSIEKVYCFLTRYPFTRFFLDTILQILNQLKLSKMKLQLAHDSESFSKIDIDFLKNYFSEDLVKILELLLNTPKSFTFDSILEFKDPKIPFQITYTIPSFNKSFYLEVDWVAGFGLSNLSEEAFAFIYMALLLENSIVFVSENLGLLTSTMMSFINLINPFKWHYPVVFNIPQDLIQILESPVPILVGINREIGFINGLFQKYNNILFICLDGDLKVFNRNLMKSYSNEDMFMKIKGIFKVFIEKLKKTNGLSNNDLLIDVEYNNSHGKDLVPNPNIQQKEIIYQFFKNIDDFLYVNLIRFIPEKPLYTMNEKNLLNYEMIRGQIKNKDRENRFLERFIQTQMLTFFLDEYYMNL